MREEAVNLRVNSYKSRVMALTMKMILKNNREKQIRVNMRKWYKRTFLIDNNLKYNPKALEKSMNRYER